ncbi:MAG: hypothetical protein M4579_000598 [Chaenotheca gracillima]|nr:MAG: hypothetical protein M4579_000598 [Chaenotheca gracillima]
MGLMDGSQDYALAPFRAATSKPAQRTYLSSILFFAASVVLLGLAIVAYSLFYFNFVPQVGIEQIVHLQFSEGQHPHGIASLGEGLVSQQAYDVFVLLDLPRSPPNLAAGNFMLNLSLLTSPGIVSFLNTLSDQDVLLNSRRPAILTYTSPLVDRFQKSASLGWFLLGWKKEAEKLSIPMMENVEFAKGWRNVPKALRLEVQSQERMMFYDARVSFVARFSGLRWILYNHRIVSFVAFTFAFWVTEMIFTLLAWILFSTYIFPAPKGSTQDYTPIRDDTDTPPIAKDQDIKAEREQIGQGLNLTIPARFLQTSTKPSAGRVKAGQIVPKKRSTFRPEVIKKAEEAVQELEQDEEISEPSEYEEEDPQEEGDEEEEAEDEGGEEEENEEDEEQYEDEEGDEGEEEEEDDGEEIVYEGEEGQEGEGEEEALEDEDVAQTTEIQPLAGDDKNAGESSGVTDDQRTERSGTVDSGIGTSLEDGSTGRPQTSIKKRKNKAKGVK